MDLSETLLFYVLFFSSSKMSQMHIRNNKSEICILNTYFELRHRHVKKPFLVRSGCWNEKNQQMKRLISQSVSFSLLESNIKVCKSNTLRSPIKWIFLQFQSLAHQMHIYLFSCSGCRCITHLNEVGFYKTV